VYAQTLLVVHRDLDFSVMPRRGRVPGGWIGEAQDNAAAAACWDGRGLTAAASGFSASRCIPATRVCSRKFANAGRAVQHGALYSALSVFDNIALPLRELTRFRTADFIRDIVMVKLDAVGMDKLAPRRRCPRICPAGY